jgi:hypothetical protein
MAMRRIELSSGAVCSFKMREASSMPFGIPVRAFPAQ